MVSPDIPVIAALMVFALSCQLAALRPDYGAPVLSLAALITGIAGWLWVVQQTGWLNRVTAAAIMLGVCLASALLAAVTRESAASV